MTRKTPSTAALTAAQLKARERRISKARRMLARIAPFDEWPGRDGLPVAGRTPREWYDLTVSVLEEEIADPSPTSVTLEQGPNGPTLRPDWD